MSEITRNEMPINDIKPFVIANVKNQLEKWTTARMSIVGAPGCGKSDIMRQICIENGWGLAVKYMSNMDLCQITGIPCQVKEGDEAKWTKPFLLSFSNLEYKPENYVEGKTPTILFIDDFHLADRTIQKYLFELLTYKSINGYSMPEKSAIILAGNRNTDRALANVIPAPVMNRLAVFEVKADADDWLNNFAFKHNIRPDIITFIGSDKGKSCLSLTPIESVPWASPRSWTFLSEQLDSYQATFGNLNLQALKSLASSLIGPELAIEFITYHELFARWNFNELIQEDHNVLKKKFEDAAKENTSAIYAICNSVAVWMISSLKAIKFDLKNPEADKVINFTFDVMTILLGLKLNNINVTPLVIAGTNYIYKFQEETIKHIDDLPKNFKFTDVLLKFLNNLTKKERPIDYIYYEILNDIFKGEPLDEQDKKKIADAHKKLGI